MRCYQKENRISTEGLDSVRTVALGEKGVMRFSPVRVKRVQKRRGFKLLGARYAIPFHFFFPSPLNYLVTFAMVKRKAHCGGTCQKIYFANST